MLFIHCFLIHQVFIFQEDLKYFYQLNNLFIHFKSFQKYSESSLCIKIFAPHLVVPQIKIQSLSLYRYTNFRYFQDIPNPKLAHKLFINFHQLLLKKNLGKFLQLIRYNSLLLQRGRSLALILLLYQFRILIFAIGLQDFQ